MSTRNITTFDRFIDQIESGLTTLATKPVADRPNPADEVQEGKLTTAERSQAASLMRVNHTGEVCAQALYQGQAATANLSSVRKKMEEAASEEIDHLAWCSQRLEELDSQQSIFNPVFYAASYTLGAVAGLISDRMSLGFVAATEQQVCEHLRDHQEQLPQNDYRSRAIVIQMIADEEKHGMEALKAGGIDFHPKIKYLMSISSKLMTKTSSII